MVRVFAGIGFIALLSGAVFGQASGVKTARPLPTFEIADVHESPHTTTPNLLKPEFKKRPIPVIAIDHIEEKPTDN